MRFFITGGTGFVGRALVARLHTQGHSVAVWTRDPARARQTLGAEADIVDAGDGDIALGRAIADADIVVNLAGAPVADRRWTQARRELLYQSRVDLTRRLVDAMGAARSRPRALVSASAVGFYGDRGSERLTEDSPAGDGFLADLCLAWEREAERAESFGVRVVTLRIGLVLGRGGGVLGTLEPIFRKGLGGPLGSGRQHQPWIHRDDLIAILEAASTDASFRGAYNAVAPHPVTQREMARVLGAALRRPASLPAPRLALRLMLGDRAQVLLASQRAYPVRLSSRGFRFAFPRLRAAIDDLVGDQQPSVTIGRFRGEVPDADYLRRRRPRYELRQSMLVAAPIDEVFEFFSAAENLEQLTPSNLGFNILTPLPIEMKAGAVIDYRIRLGPVPMKWKTEIEAWEPGRRFVDTQTRGPYACWWHEHCFEAVDGGTLVSDRVLYAPPLGPLGAIAHRILIAPMLRRIFGFRGQAIRARFGAPDALDRRAA